MRIILISTMDGSPWGGSEELWSRTAVRLKQAGHDIHALVQRWPQLSDKVTALMRQGIEVRTHTTHREKFARRVWKRISGSERRDNDWVTRPRPDLVVISQGHNSGGLQWAQTCRDAGIPYVLIVHCNSEHLWFPDSAVPYVVGCYSAAQRVYCVSQRNLELLRLQLGDPLVNAEVVRNPCNVSPDPPPAWPAHGETTRVACVARLEATAKGHDLLLQVLARPEWRDRKIELNIFGTGPNENLLRRLAQMLQTPNVNFHGHVSDVGEIWRNNHLLMLPSRYEGLPLSLVEAAWSGRAAVVTDVGGNAELCLDNETGFVAQSATVAAFSEALERAWRRRQDWPSMGKAARAQVETMFPRDPVGVFCNLLLACAQSARSASSVQTGSRVGESVQG